LAEYYSENCLIYGQVIKIREGGKVVEKSKKPVYGNPDTKKIETRMWKTTTVFSVKDGVVL